MSALRHTSPPVDPWLWARTATETLLAGLDPGGMALHLRDARLQGLMERAMADSPFYRRRMGRRRGNPPPLAEVPATDKHELMHAFDDWATDRQITRRGVDQFLHDADHLADAYLDKYMVWTSSGTSGEPGIFVQDGASLAVFDALDVQRLRGMGLGQAPFAWWSATQRFAFVAATGGHFAGVASAERVRRLSATARAAMPWLAPVVQTFSVLEPLADLQRQLQEFRPTVLVTYPSCAEALARGQASGDMALSLTEVWVGGEQLSDRQREHIRAAFGCALRNNYGASEFYTMAWECPQGRLHLNHDWVLLEPVDRQMRPVPPGEPSHSVLLTNLANQTQPLLRYALGDSLRLVGEPCRCGSGFPVIEVQGRSEQTLVMNDARGRPVTLLPLALITVIEEGAQVTQFQLLHTGPGSLDLRFEPGLQDPAQTGQRARTALGSFLTAHGLPRVEVTLSGLPPVRHAISGKLCRVVLEAPSAG
jgi:phenylacetate-coenzyme A ligase PaaK-like adenylate-forming protein